MTQEELNQARTNPEFLKYLQETQDDAIKTKNISALYEVLDSLLILDLTEEDRVNLVYNQILEIAFEKIEEALKAEKRLGIEGDELYYIRAFYELGIEKWSNEDCSGAKELFFILAGLVDNEALSNALDVHIISCAKDISIDQFYEKDVNTEALGSEENHGYFIINFLFDTKEFLDENKEILQNEYKNLKHLVEA